MEKLLLTFVLVGATSLCLAQKKKDKKEKEEEEEAKIESTHNNDFTTEIPLTIDLEKEEEEEEAVAPKKKKRKKKVFYEIKTKRRYTKKGYGEKTTLELFHVLKVYEAPDPYVRDFYWLDDRRHTIRKGGKFDEKYGSILHGPYEKRRGKQVLEKGIFYKGTKHGRWVKYSKDDILVDKEKYIKGWPKESVITYYNNDKTKPKEVTPVEYGEKEGYYYYFFENGLWAVRGEYKFGQKVGKWTENHPNTLQKKKVVQYSEDPYDKEFEPHTWREWNRRGKVVYDHDKDKSE